MCSSRILSTSYHYPSVCFRLWTCVLSCLLSLPQPPTHKTHLATFLHVRPCTRLNDDVLFFYGGYSVNQLTVLFLSRFSRFILLGKICLVIEQRTPCWLFVSFQRGRGTGEVNGNLFVLVHAESLIERISQGKWLTFWVSFQ